MKTTITKRVTFCAGHRLFNPQFSDEKNRIVFGDCSNPNGHGHNYVLEVSVTGAVDTETSMIISLKDLKAIIDSEIVSRIDHKNLNLDVDFLRGLIPTTETLANKIWEILDARFGGGMLTRIVLWESDNNRFEVTR
ncbi:MAG: 6-carboxytetrahydropterin synthase [Candidatus Zixiibacteriota bacterium]|nr:MAG: 6-carboxytetrahydropterin synthase [candidate division Zixibacteria bacterium]